MKKRRLWIALALTVVMGLMALALTACSNSGLDDGSYTAKFTTDSKMFHVNEAYNDYGLLTVKDGKMTIHVTLVSKRIVNLYLGTAEDAANADEADILQPTTDEVTYEDGTTDKVYGFDIPVDKLDEEFDCAILGKSGKWYDHKVKVSEAELVNGDGDVDGDE